MKLSEMDLPVVYLQPGEVYYSERPTLVMTVLGSCISVTMFNLRLGFGGICHVLLPKCRTETCAGVCDEAYRYMDCAIKGMIGQFAGKGSDPGQIEVKIFGGSDILMVDGHEKYVSVGKQNIEVAKRIFLEEGLKVRASHVGGTQGRKIFFFTHTGEVLMKKIHRSSLRMEDYGRDEEEDQSTYRR